MSHRQRDHFSDPSVRISKKLSRILRHRAEDEGFKLMHGGFLYVDDLLRHKDFKGVTVEQIQNIVDTNDKKRFTLETDKDSGRLKICANQGHSLKVDDLDLKPIADAALFPVVVHGTNEKCLGKIIHEGLKPMGRNHVHFAPGEPGEDGVISGMRNSCSIVIYVNLHRALRDGLKFYLSANNVILCEGDENGVILPKYFDKIKNRRSGKTQYFNQDVVQPQDQQSVLTTSVVDDDIPAAKGTVTAEELADEMDERKSRRKKKNK